MSCFKIIESTMCPSWDNQLVSIGTTIENTDITIVDTRSLDLAILDVLDSHYKLINTECSPNFYIPNYATWLCDGVIEKSTCSNLRICGSTCSTFSQEYKNLTTTCKGDIYTQQLTIGSEIDRYCLGLNQTQCVVANSNLQHNCGLSSKADICSNCSTKLGEFCKIDQIEETQKIDTWIYIVSIFAAVIFIICVCIFVIYRINLKKKRKLKNNPSNTLQQDNSFYNEKTTVESISDSSRKTSITNFKNTQPVTQVGRYSHLIRTSDASFSPASSISIYSGFYQQQDSSLESHPTPSPQSDLYPFLQ